MLLIMCTLIYSLFIIGFRQNHMFVGLRVVIGVLCGLELILALVLIFWESKAVCRSHFNTLVSLKSTKHAELLYQTL